MPKTHEKAASKEASPKKKSIFKDIFGSEEEPDFVPEQTQNSPVVIEAAFDQHNRRKSCRGKRRGKKTALLDELRQEVEDFSDV